MLTEDNSIRGDRPTTRLLWDGVEVVRVMGKPGNKATALRMGHEHVFARTEIMGQALAAWFVGRGIDVELETIEGRDYLVRDDKKLPVYNLSSTTRLDPDLNNIQIEGELWENSTIFKGEQERVATPDKPLATVAIPSPRPSPLPARANASHTRGQFKVPPVRGRYYPVYGARFDVAGDEVVIRFQDEPVIAMAPGRVEVAPINFDKRRAQRLDHLVEALPLGFTTRRHGAFTMLSPLPGFVASTADGDLASDGDWLALNQAVTVEAC